MKKSAFALSLILVVTLLTGCAGVNLPFLPTPTPEITATPQPTATLLPTATPTLTPTPLPAVRIERGDAEIFVGDFSAAIQEYESAASGADEDDTRIAAQIGTAKAYYAQGDCGSVLAILEPLTAQYPEQALTAAAYYFLGECYEAEGAYDRAAAAFEGYTLRQPGVLDRYMRTRQAMNLEAAGDMMGAIAAYQAAIEAAGSADTERLQVRIARAYAAMGDYSNAVRLYLLIYEQTASDYTRAEMNLLSGQAYTALGMPEQAYARYMDSILNYPRSYDSYSGLVDLVNSGQPVDELVRGLVDYYAGQYGVAVEAFQRYLAANVNHEGSVHYFMGWSYLEMGSVDEAIAEWRMLIRDHAGDRYWSSAWFDIAEAQWMYLDEYGEAAQTLLDYVALVPDANDAAEACFTAARILERDGRLSEAADTWERMINDYSNAENAYQALFLAGITHYRLGDFAGAQTIFQRNLVLAWDAHDQAKAGLWVGKAMQAQGNADGAQAAWQAAAAADPTGYYSERARDLLAGIAPFEAPPVYDLAYNPEREREKAEGWLRNQFNIPPEVNLSGLDNLAGDSRMQRGLALWDLGLYTEARTEFEDLRKSVENDAVATYRLMNQFLEVGLYRSAILAARQVLTLANLSDAETLQAPVYFNHIRFGTYYRDYVTQAAQVENLHPLLLFSVIRQESFFEGFVQSSAGARGVMQIMPATGAEIAMNMNWPPDYDADDLYRPSISIPMGAHYLTRWTDYLEGDIVAGLAAYNSGPGNSQTWKNLANGDPDLFVEVIRYPETQNYVRYIYENFKIYSGLYERRP